MATKTKPRRKSYSLSLQLAAGRVDAATGVLYACTVAKAGVKAAGKLVFLDKNGKVTFDEEQMVKELPVYTDETTLDTILSAAANAGPKIKAREDHDDSIGARAGFFEMFKKDGDRLVADMHLFASYRNRDVVLETADKTPQEIGLSIDFIPTFDLLPDRALMRCKQLLAVDIVDEGAITPGGLFLSAGVDSDANDQLASPAPETNPPMPENKNPFTEEQLSAVSTLVAKTVAECMAKMSAPALPAEVTDGLKAIREEQVRLAAESKANGDKMVTIVADNLRLKKTASALGLRVLPNEKDRATLASGTVEDIEKLANPGELKTYDQIVTERVTSTKCKRTEAHLWAMKAHASEYRDHLKAKGIFDPAKVRTA
jgi:hypothetical protein